MGMQTGLLGMPQAPVISAERLAQQQKVLEGKADPSTLQQHQQQSIMETYQMMLYHQQMTAHFQTMLAQQVALQQQQMMNQGANGSTDNTAAANAFA